jgi:hypothetical protein
MRIFVLTTTHELLVSDHPHYLRNPVLAKVWQKLVVCYKNACADFVENVIEESIIVICTPKNKNSQK